VVSTMPKRKLDKKNNKLTAEEITEQGEVEHTSRKTDAQKSLAKKKRKEKLEHQKKEQENREDSLSEPPHKKRKTSESENSTESKFLSDNAQFLAKFRAEHHITVEGLVTNFKPYGTFSEPGFPSELIGITKTFGKPTPIQSQCWPIILANKDIIGIAETGSGKTLAFALPGLWHVMESPRSNSPVLLVLSPTRELAMQTTEVIKKAGEIAKIKAACLYGGVDKGPQRTALRAGVQAVVATPGRLLDLIQEGECDLSGITFLVLDEADRMLDLGFEKDIRTIIGMTDASQRQTLMFSATWPLAIQNLAKEFMKNAIKVTVGTDTLSANKKINQIVEVIEDDKRDNRLLELLELYHKQKNNKILIFALYKREAARLQQFLTTRKWACLSIHGDQSQNQRTHALQSFVDGKTCLLIATDVASRGLHIPRVEYVINFSFPLTIEDYVHRIGRTGRAGSTGISHTFFTKFDKAHSGALVKVLKDAKQLVPEDLLKFGVAMKKKEPKLGKIDMVSQQSSHITFDSDDE